MSNIYIRSTDGSDGDNGSTWALAKASIGGAVGISAAGDTMYVSQTHAETKAGSVNCTLVGSAANPVRVIAANDAAEPPTATAATASITMTGAGAFNVNGLGYVQGIAFNCGNGFNYSQLYVARGGGVGQLTLENCDLNLLDTHPSSFLQIGSDSTGEATRVNLINTRLRIADASQQIRLYRNVKMSGMSFIAGGASNTGAQFVVGSTSTDTDVLIENSDFSNLASNVALFYCPAGSHGQVRLRNCKLPASWTGALCNSITQSTWSVEMHNCDAGATNYKTWIERFEGAIRSETTVVKTGGASDGTTPKSLKMTSNGNASESVGGLVSPYISDWIDTAGSAKTVTVDILHDSVTALTNAEVWLEVDYLGSSATPQGTKAISKRATILTTAAAVTTSAATWTTTGLTNPNKQKLSVTFTPQMKGEFLTRVVLAKPSKTIYVDPVAQVS